MAPKYQCPKCDKRFIDWGAEKLGFLCPDCDGEKLLLVGLETGSVAKPKKKKAKAKTKTKAKAKKKKPSLKRKVKEEPVSNFDDDLAPLEDEPPTEDLSVLEELGDVPEVDNNAEDLKGLTIKDGKDKD